MATVGLQPPHRPSLSGSAAKCTAGGRVWAETAADAENRTPEPGFRPATGAFRREMILAPKIPAASGALLRGQQDWAWVGRTADSRPRDGGPAPPRNAPLQPHYRHLGPFPPRSAPVGGVEAAQPVHYSAREALEYCRDGGYRYVGYAESSLMDEGREPGEGAEVFSLLRASRKKPKDYINRFYDSGHEIRGRG